MMNAAQAKLVSEHSIPKLLDELLNRADAAIKAAADNGNERVTMQLSEFPERIRASLAYRLKKLGFKTTVDGSRKTVLIRWSEDTL